MSPENEVAVLLNRTVANASSTEMIREAITAGTGGWPARRVLEATVPRREALAQAFGAEAAPGVRTPRWSTSWTGSRRPHDRPRSPGLVQADGAGRRAAASAPGKPAGPAPRAKPVRLSVDLAPTAYRELQEFCNAAAIALERPRVAGVDVLRSLLAELAEDLALAARVQARLARD